MNSNNDDSLLDDQQFLMDRPNSYTISKALAECLIAEKYFDLPIAICRPSIVTHAFAEPSQGWCDTFNGLGGYLSVAGLGILQTLNGIETIKVN